MNAEDEAYFDALGTLYLQAVISEEQPALLQNLGGVFGLAGRDADHVRVNQGGVLGFIGWIRDPRERRKAARETWSAHEKAMRRLAARQHWPAARAAAQYISAHTDRTSMPTLHQLQSFGSVTMGELGTKPSWLYELEEVHEAFSAGLEVMTGPAVPAINAGLEELHTGDWNRAIESGRQDQVLWRALEVAAPLAQRRSAPALALASGPPRVLPTRFERGTDSRGVGDRGVRSPTPTPAARGLEAPRPATPRIVLPTPARSSFVPTIAGPPPVVTAARAIDESAARGVVVAREAERGWQTAPPSRLDFSRIVVDSESQANMLGALLGRRFSSSSGTPRGRLSRGQQRVVEALAARIEKHWREATPPGYPTAEAAARRTYEQLQRERPRNPTEFVRDRLFRTWRNRFVTRVLKDRSLVTALQRHAGIRVRKEGTKFTVRSLTDRGTFAEVALNIDHYTEALAQSVSRAISTGSFAPLVSVVDSANLAFLFGRENQVAVEALRAVLRVMGQEVRTGDVLQTIERWIEHQ